VLYLTKPRRAVAGVPETKPNVPRGVPGRRGPAPSKQGAAA
jgi:hypothetical protein